MVPSYVSFEAIQFSNVVFPHPLDPRITVIPLLFKSKEIPFNASTSLF